MRWAEFSPPPRHSEPRLRSRREKGRVRAADIPTPSAAPDDEQQFAVTVHVEAGCRVVRAAGELDLESSESVTRACVDGDELTVVVDMSGLTFMDCRGYGSLAGARRILESRSGTLTLLSPIGEPAHLLALLSQLRSLVSPSNLAGSMMP